jgi:hypothetical protein
MLPHLALVVMLSPAAPPPDAVDNGRALVTITPRIGVAFPGTATPRKISHTKVGFGFPLQVAAVLALADHFELGSYLHCSLRPITERSTAPTEGLRNHLVSVGAVAKARFAVSSRSRMRIGVMLGYNRTWQGFENDTFDGTITAHGLNVFPSVEWSHDIANHVAVNVQLAAISQVWGKADLGAIGAIVSGGSKQRMAYPPLAFLAVGFDFCLGARP